MNSCKEDPKPDPCAGMYIGNNKINLFTVIETGDFYTQKLLSLNDTIIFPNGYACDIQLIPNNQNPTSYIDMVSIVGLNNPNDTYGSIGLQFESQNKNAETFQWKLKNSNQTFTTSGFYLNFKFSINQLPYRETVTLITKNKVNIDCKSDKAKTMDTISRTLIFTKLSQNELHPIYGTYKGTINNNISDTMTLDIKNATSTEYHGVSPIEPYTTYYPYDTRKYCWPSISNIFWNKTNSIDGKRHTSKRIEVRIENNTFNLSPILYETGFGYVNNNALVLIARGAVFNKYITSPRGNYYEPEYYTITFTGQKIN